MENTVKSRLESVQLGRPQTYKNITILPLIAPPDGIFQYRTLGEALGTWDIAITEVSAAGSVPELLVVNRANKPVLLVDGEELAGAKQNRVLNTSILLKEVSETKIPVSCTEQGRWSYASKAFSESGHLMAHKARARKTRSVHNSLEACGAPMSDQGQVWSDISKLQAQAGAPSPTAAMSDVYKAREDDLRQCDEIFKSVPNQVGLLAIINGQPAGLDMVSLTSAYAKLHSKLVRSYTLEALLDNPPSPHRLSMFHNFLAGHRWCIGSSWWGDYLRTRIQFGTDRPTRGAGARSVATRFVSSALPLVGLEGAVGGFSNDQRADCFEAVGAFGPASVAPSPAIWRAG